MKILYCGSPKIACDALEILSMCEEIQIGGVLTNPATPQKRGKILQDTAVFQTAQKIRETRGMDFSIWTPEKLDENFCSQIRDENFDLLVCFAYGKIFKKAFLDLFALGGINFHPSLLPRHRGPSPIPAAIMAGDEKTGVTVQRLAEKMDSGNILLQKEFPLNGTETAASVMDSVAKMAGDCLVEVILQLMDGTQREVPQNEDEATFCHLLRREDGKIDWAKTSKEIDGQIRGLNPAPVAFTNLKDRLLFIHDTTIFHGDDALLAGKRPGEILSFDKKNGVLIKAGDGAIAAKTLQWQQKNPLNFKDFANGNGRILGEILGDIPGEYID